MVAPVAVVVPTFNREGTLGRALESVARQTRPASAVVVVDDGSTDDTLSVFEEFEKVGGETEWRYVFQENAGPSSARNVGAAVVGAPWLAFLDSDDEWRPEKLERQINAATGRSEVRIWHCDEIWIRRGNQVLQRRKHRKRGGWIYSHCLPLCAISPSAVILDRELFQSVGGFDESLPVCEDYDLWLRLCLDHEVGFVDEELVVKYGGHDDQLSRSVPAMDRFRCTALENILNSRSMSSQDFEATKSTLLSKLEVLRAGAAKRSLKLEAEDYASRLDRWTDAVAPEGIDVETSA